MTYEHCIHTTAPESLAAAYQQAGFIAVIASAGWVLVYTDYDESVREKVERIAWEHGADYDGGGMYFGPLSAGEAS